jgi:phosphatidylinositol alpha-1,6-mannosyltransferase
MDQFSQHRGLMHVSGRVAFLHSDGFGGFGGIAKFNRDFLTALDATRNVERVHAFPRLIREPIEAEIPESVVYYRRGARGKLAFASNVMAFGIKPTAVDVVICGHINLLPVAFALARMVRCRLTLVIHGIDAWTPPRSRLLRLLISRVDSFLSVSHISAERFCRWSGASMELCTVLPNAVDIDRFRVTPPDPALIERYGLHGSKVLMTLGRMDSRERYKGFDQVIEALPWLKQLAPKLKYLMVGDGPDQPRLDAKCKTLGIADDVIFAGRVSESEKVAHYNLADVYVMPSSGEGFGIVLIEAAACGLPIVGSKFDGSREALLGGILGRLIDPNDRQELLEAVLAALRAGKPSRRNDAVETFGIPQFQARVSDWIARELITAVS